MAGPLDSIVTVNIIATSAAPTRSNFGIPIVLAYHTHNTDKVRSYRDLAAMVADGFSVTEPAYLMAQAIVSQNPRPPVFKVGRLTTAVAQTFTFTVTDNTDGHKVGLSLLNTVGVAKDLYTTVASQTLAQVATALAAVIDAEADLAAVAAGPVVTVTLSTAGKAVYPLLTPAAASNFAGGFQGGTFADTTASASIATDLAAILLVDPAFYGVSIQQIDATNIGAVAAWAEANKRIFAYDTADSANLTAGSGVMNTLKGQSYKYSFGMYSQSPGQFGALGLMAQRFTVVPGTDTWAYKQVAGLTPDNNLNPTQLGNITTNNGNYYTTIAGVNVVTDGRSAQGQFMDIQRGLDALADEVQVEVGDLLFSSEKVPYDAAGIQMVAGRVRKALKAFTATAVQPNLFLSNDPGFQPVVTVPELADISAVDKKNRVLKSVNFTATATGGIHTATINGTVSF